MSADGGELRFALTDSPSWIAVVCAVLVIALVVGSADLWRRGARTGGGARVPTWSLIVLRAVLGVVIALVALQPEWVRQDLVAVQGQVAVLVDRSRSMTTADGNGITRQVQAAELVRRWQREAVPARFYGFGGKLQPLALDGLLDSRTLQDATAIDGALEAVTQSFGPELGAVVVISDGHQVGAAVDMARMAQRGVRVHTIAVGAGDDAADDAIVSADAPALAFVQKQTAVRVKVRAVRLAGQSVQLLLRRGDDVVADGIVTLGADGTGETSIEFTPERVGRELYQLELATSERDPIPENNQRAFLVRVARERTRVLLVSGRPGWDARYLRGLLNADPAVDLITFFILRTPHDMPLASPEEMSLIPFPTDELFREHLGSFDVVIFQDFEYGPYEMARYLPGIAQYVKQGGSFAMVGGSQSFGSGGYARTPIAEVLPVAISDGTDVLEGAFRPVIDSRAREHPIVRLSPDGVDNQALWEGVAPVLGTQAFLGLRGNAHALLRHPTARARDGSLLPVLVTGHVERGRVLALGLDTSWRWGISSAAVSGDASLYARFWDRVLRWLTRDPLLDPSQLHTDQERYAPDASIEVTGQLRDVHYVPIANQSVRLDVRGPRAAVVTSVGLTTDHEGRVHAVLDGPPGVGGFVVTASTERGEILVELPIMVERGGPELSDVSAQPETLAQLAKATGGEHYADVDDAPSLADLDRSRTRSTGLSVSAPFKSPWFVTLAIALLALEWFARRRSGLR